MAWGCPVASDPAPTLEELADILNRGVGQPGTFHIISALKDWRRASDVDNRQQLWFEVIQVLTRYKIAPPYRHAVLAHATGIWGKGKRP